jgi:phospholipase C
MRTSSLVSRYASFVLLLASAAGVSSCAGGQSGSMPPAAPGGPANQVPQPKKATGNVQHIIIIVQENQSFDHLFNGYPGADTVQTCKIHTGATVPLTEQDLGAPTGTSHMSTDFLTDYDGGALDGFDLDPSQPRPNLKACSYTNPADIQPYYQMAQEWVLDDKMFTSHIDASFVAHQYIVAAQANSAVNLPQNTWGCTPPSQPDLVPTLNQDRTIGPFESPCFTYKTLADELDAKGFTWRFYTPAGSGWSSFIADSSIFYSSEYANVISPETNILTDIPNGTLENVTWVVPNYCNSDHPGSLGDSSCPSGVFGPQWVASIVNAVGESQFWDSTAIFVLWDEWGGEYDHVAPPYKDYDGDGFRVPMLCISPYAYQNKVNHDQLEIAGIPHFVEKTFGLATLAAADKRAKPAMTGCLNSKASGPRAFQPIQASVGPNFFLHVQSRRGVQKSPD